MGKNRENFPEFLKKKKKRKKRKWKKTNWKIIFIQIGDAKINYNFIIKNHQINHFSSSTKTICRNTTYFFLLFSSIYSSFFRVWWKKVRVQKYELWPNLPVTQKIFFLFPIFNVKNKTHTKSKSYIINILNSIKFT